MDNNKNQRLVNYLSAILLILIMVIISYSLYTHRITLNEPSITSTTTTIQFPYYPGRAFFIPKDALLSILIQSGIEMPENSIDNLNDLFNTPEKQLSLMEIFWPSFAEIVNQQPKDSSHPIRELSIAIRNNNNKGIIVIFSDLSNPKWFQKGDLVIFGVNLEDILTSQNLSITKDTPLYICDSIEPSFPVLEFESYYSDYMLKFNEGTVGCNEGLTTDSGYRNWWWLGILNNDSYKVKIYLVDENTRSQIQKSSSFSEAEGILNNYRLIYEKNITLSN